MTVPWTNQYAELNSSLNDVVFSGIVAIRDRLLQHPNPLRLESGDPSFDTPEHIKEAVVKALRDNHTHYAPSTGIMPLKEAIISKLNHKNRISSITSPDQVLVTNGGMHALYVAMTSLLNEGDEVILPLPNWTATNWIVTIAGGTPVRVQLKPELGFRWDIEDVRAAITPRTKAILINSPHNPTGGVMQRDDLLDLLGLVEEHDLFVIADEAYEDIVYDAEHLAIASLAAEFSVNLQERIISAFTFSKSYAMTGWRLGYLACSHPRFCDNAKKMILYTINGVSTPTQYAGIAALEGPQDCIANMLGEYRKRRDLLFEGVAKCSYLNCDLPPKGAIYLYAAVTDEWRDSDWDLVDHLIDAHGLGCVPGNQFGDKAKHLRFCFACSTEMIEKAMMALSR